MENELLKFIVDLGSIGAICFVVWCSGKERIETHRKFLETLDKYLETIQNITNKIKGDDE